MTLLLAQAHCGYLHLCRRRRRRGRSSRCRIQRFRCRHFHYPAEALYAQALRRRVRSSSTPIPIPGHERCEPRASVRYGRRLSCRGGAPHRRSASGRVSTVKWLTTVLKATLEGAALRHKGMFSPRRSKISRRVSGLGVVRGGWLRCRRGWRSMRSLATPPAWSRRCAAVVSCRASFHHLGFLRLGQELLPGYRANARLCRCNMATSCCGERKLRRKAVSCLGRFV